MRRGAIRTSSHEMCNDDKHRGNGNSCIPDTKSDLASVSCAQLVF
jgi:hypothetical protein